MGNKSPIPHTGHEKIHEARIRSLADDWKGKESAAVADLPSDSSVIHVLGVDYIHTVDEAGGELYLTPAGFEFAELLDPDNWFDPAWFRSQRERLEGTGSVYAVPAKPIRGETLVLVVKFSRVGEKVPIDTDLIENVLCCEFNGPFEEFGLVEELRASRRGASGPRFETQLPLAIYVPPERAQPSQTRRFQWRVARKVAQHPGVAIDILRQYIMVYRWLPGIDAWQAHRQGLLSEQEMDRLNERATAELRTSGFTVLDMKPEHQIVQVTGPDDVARAEGQIAYGLIDFELLERTAEHWQEIQTARNVAYHRRREALLRPDATGAPEGIDMPANLQRVMIFGVDYIHGRTESTGGMLWVVGRDPELFDYFVPERWRTTPQLRFGDIRETYFTTSKDNLRLVWKVSRVGEPPKAAAFGVRGFQVLAHGFNSPFEEIAAAWWLGRRGVPVTVPCAVYRTGHRSQLAESLSDPSRYRSHAHLTSIDGSPVLEPLRNYITVWDFWGRGEPDAENQAAAVSRSVNASQALERGLLCSDEVDTLVSDFGDRLAAVSVEALRLKPTHILLSVGEDGTPARDDDGRLNSCLCNFQYLMLPADADPGAD